MEKDKLGINFLVNLERKNAEKCRQKARLKVGSLRKKKRHRRVGTRLHTRSRGIPIKTEVTRGLTDDCDQRRLRFPANAGDRSKDAF